MIITNTNANNNNNNSEDDTNKIILLDGTAYGGLLGIYSL